MNCLQGTSFCQLTLARKTDIKNSGRATPELVISQSLPSKIQNYAKKFNPAIYAKHKWLSGCAEINTLLSVPIHHKIILVPTKT